MTVQDDSREHELCNLFNLEWDPDHARGGDDAWFAIKIRGKTVRVPVEVKSTTTDSVSTARDVGLDHINRWRSKIWLIGYYSTVGFRGKPRLGPCLCLTPDEMEPWIAQVESYILPDIQIADRVSSKLSIEDLGAICGAKDRYTLTDAQALYKKQWSIEEYRGAMDMDGGYSAERMLDILRKRAHYLISRGSTLNNPHVPKRFLKTFEDQLITKEHAARIRLKFKEYLSRTKTK
jgi:hypothetical protein